MTQDQVPKQVKYEAAAPKVLLMGEIGSGKTRSIRTLIDAGVEVFLVSTEPGFETLLGNIPPDKLHWCYIPAYKSDREVLKSIAKLVNTVDIDQIKKMPGIGRQKYQEWFKLLAAFDNYIDDRTGKEYGDVATFGPDKAVVIDSLSGVSNMAYHLLGGDKPCLSWPEFDACQFNIREFINTLTQTLNCWFVLTAHVERETDQLTGLQRLMVSTLGKALAPQLPKYFSEVILCEKIMQGDKLKWVWNNISMDARVKFRNLPPSNSCEQDFRIIKHNWEQKTTY